MSLCVFARVCVFACMSAETESVLVVLLWQRSACSASWREACEAHWIGQIGKRRVRAWMKGGWRWCWWKVQVGCRKCCSARLLTDVLSGCCPLTTHTCLMAPFSFFLKLRDSNNLGQNDGKVGGKKGGWWKWRGESLMGKGRGNRLSSKRNPLAHHGPCSVCIPTVGMIVGAEEDHCSSWIFFSIEQRDGWKRGREEGKRQKEG